MSPAKIQLDGIREIRPWGGSLGLPLLGSSDPASASAGGSASASVHGRVMLLPDGGGGGVGQLGGRAVLRWPRWLATLSPPCQVCQAVAFVKLFPADQPSLVAFVKLLPADQSSN